jgi:hypothetical protein
MVNSKQGDKAIRFSIRRLLVVIVFVAALLAVVRFSIHAYKSAFKGLEDFNAIWLAHDMLTTYVSRTNGEWPDNWDDLQPIFDSPMSQPYGAPDLDWVRDRIAIDFDIDPNAFVASNNPEDRSVDAIRMADGTQNGETRDANARIKSVILKYKSP